VVMYPDMRGWLLYRVESGDTLTAIVRKARDFGRTTIAQIVAANSQIEDPDVIQVGWRLRIPIS
jgi:nucleoid-associated protein YgaU